MVHMKSMLEEPVSRFNETDEHVQLDANPRILFLDQTDVSIEKHSKHIYNRSILTHHYRCLQ
jgi:hypothetical protein